MNENKELTERAELKKWLKRGDMLKIAEICDVSRDTVYRWFSGAEIAAIELVVNRIVQMRKDQAESAAEKVVNQ